MHKKTNLAGIMILLVAALLLAACSTPSAPAAPTADANAVYTQAAATVAANLTQSAAKNPTSTATPEPPTATPTQSNPTATVTVQQAGTTKTTQTTTPLAGAAGQPTATKGTGLLVPTATKAAGAPPAATGDKAAWVSQGPADGATMPKSATFNVVYVLKNTGTTTWTKAYTFRFYAGDKLSSPNDLNLTKEVKPGDTVQILFTLIAPDSATKTHTVWTIANDQGANFYYVTLDLNIN